MSSAASPDSSASPAADPPFDGDPAWRVVRALRDGTEVIVRPVTPEDRDELRRGFLQLSAESRYYRFLHLGALPTDELLTYLTTVDQRDHVAIGATITSPDLKTERGVGIARFVRLPGPGRIAEGAITVPDDMHRRGVGTVLLRELLRAAKARGVETLRAEVLADNEKMRAILERAGAKRAGNEEEDGTVAYDLAIEREEEEEPSLFDVLRGAAETMALRFRR